MGCGLLIDTDVACIDISPARVSKDYIECFGVHHCSQSTIYPGTSNVSPVPRFKVAFKSIGKIR